MPFLSTFQSIPLRKKILLGLILPVALLASISISVFYSLEKQQKTADMVEHTHKVIASAHELSKLLIDMETGERGYLITGNKDFLEPYFEASSLWELKLNALKRLVSDNPAQKVLLLDIEELQEQWQVKAANVEIATRQQMDKSEQEIMADVVFLIEQETGKNIIDAIRRIKHKFIAVEQNLMTVRQAENLQASKQTRLLIIVGTLAALLIACAAIFIIFNSISRNLNQLISGTERVSGGDFSQPIKVDSKDEFQRLADAFNMMSYSLKKSIEELETALKVKSNFLANMSHEIRTPMNGILGMLSFLENSKLDRNQREYIDSIRSCGNGLLVVINDILDISKLEAGKLAIETKPFNIRKAVNEVCFLLDNEISQKGLALRLRVDTRLAQYYLGDEIRIKQILLNLLNNAIKFTDAGEILVSVSQYGEEVRFTVKDQGIGISDADQTKLFKPFSQVDASITRKYGGTGLGLIICAQLIKQMKGNIKVESELGDGSKFVFKLPLAITHDVPASEIVADSESDTKDFAVKYPLSILVVEDNNINQVIAKKMFSQLGYLVAVAADGEKAVQVTQNKKFDVVYMDMQMPIMDGVTATKIILDEQQNNPPYIVAMTANVLQEDRDRCSAAGMKDFIGKPIAIDDIKRTIIDYVANKPS